MTPKTEPPTRILTESASEIPLPIPSPVTPPSFKSEARDGRNPLTIPVTPPSPDSEAHRDHRVPPPLSVPSIILDDGLPFRLTPTRPTIIIEKQKHTNLRPETHCYWIRIIDMDPIKASGMLTPQDADRATWAIRDMYLGKIVYLESKNRLQPRQIDHMTATALLLWHETGHMSALAIGNLSIDLRIIEPKNLYEAPFKLMDIPRYRIMETSLSLIPLAGLVVDRRVVLGDGSVCENVDVVTLRSGLVDTSPSKGIIHKKMMPDTMPEDMIVEANRYLALSGCKYAPKLLGVTGEPNTGECRGLLIELIEGVHLRSMPFMYNSMRLEVTMKLVKALVAFEDRGVYLQDLKPENVILTADDGLYVIDFGPGVSDGFFPEEELDDILAGRVGIKTAMYGLSMTLRMIWSEGVLGEDGLPLAPTRLRDRTPACLLPLLDNPGANMYPSFLALQDKLREECMSGEDRD